MIYLADTNLSIKATVISKPWHIYIILLLVNAFWMPFFNACIFLTFKSFFPVVEGSGLWWFCCSLLWDIVTKACSADSGCINQCCILTHTHKHTHFHMLLLPTAEKLTGRESIFIKIHENYCLNLWCWKQCLQRSTPPPAPSPEFQVIMHCPVCILL